ncbi:MAG: hypothetical protein A3H32_14990 [Betaproteobacteria bacterium RIFCSPLOWO2_02_FULL_63_19]|nr:MAG: hypothetical protein A3H32_14990 [Betaproteobacteria bacterium RIFCSPLOWO2_02_FULL_63_19]
MNPNVLRNALRAAVLATVICASTALAADSAPGVPADVESLIKRMEESGALDAAIDRGIQRHIQRQIEARKKEQETLQKRRQQAARNARPVDVNRDRIFGNVNAEVSVIVYTDFECPFCKRFAGVPEQAISKFDGKANLVFRHYPLEFHGANAKRGAYYAECVGRQSGSGAFFTFANDWFRQTVSNGKGLPQGDQQIRELALKAGVKDLAALDTCAKDPTVAQMVKDDTADGTRSGISGTPGIIVRNNRTGASLSITGAVPAAQVEQTIAEALKG